MADHTIKIKTELDNKVSGELSKIKGSLYAAFGAISVGLIANFTVKLAGLASSANEVKNKFDVIFGGSKKISKELDELGRKTGYASSSLQEMVSSLAALIKPAGFSADKTFELSKRVTQLSLDLGSFMNLRPQDIITDFQSALAGSSETLQKYGIDARETTLAQQAFSMGLITTAKQYEKLDPEQKRHIRTLALIEKAIKDTKSAQGDLERTSDAYANKTRALNESLKMLGESLGYLLLPALSNVVNVANSGIKWVQDFIDVIFKSDIEKQIDQMKRYGASIEAVTEATEQKDLFEMGKKLIQLEDDLKTAVDKTNKYFEGKRRGVEIANMDFEKYIELQKMSDELGDRILERSKKEFDIMMAQHKAGVKTTQTTTDWSKALIEQKNVIDTLLKSFDDFIQYEDQIEDVKNGVIATTKEETTALTNSTQAIKESNKAIKEKIKLSQEWRDFNRDLEKEIKKETMFDWGEGGSPEDEIKRTKELSENKIKIAEQEAEALKAIDDERIKASIGFFGAMADLSQAFFANSKSGFAAYKAFAYAETIISTYKAAQDAYSAGMKLAAMNPLLAPAATGIATANAVIAIAAGLARAAMIAQQEYNPRKEYGGSVQSGSAYTVGERGREVFVPNTDGHIISNKNLKKLSGKTIVLNINTMDATSFQDFLRRGGMKVLQRELNR